MAISKVLAKGDFVFALPPAQPIFKLAKEGWYLAAEPSPAGTCWVYPFTQFQNSSLAI
jgi:hypothetical protein